MPATTPRTYTPAHLAERILTSRSGIEGERKQITVLFADVRGPWSCLRTATPKRRASCSTPVLERMMEAVHRYEGTVNQVMGDGIMALFGAPFACEDHAVRACFAALRMRRNSSATPKNCAVRKDCRCTFASASTPAKSWCARSATICTWITPRSVRPRISPRAWSKWRSRIGLHFGEHVAAGGSVGGGHAAGAAPGQRPRCADRSVRAQGRDAAALDRARGRRASREPLRRARAGARPSHRALEEVQQAAARRWASSARREWASRGSSTSSSARSRAACWAAARCRTRMRRRGRS